MAVQLNPATQQFIESLKQRPDVTGVLLFGSWARGNNRPDSDVDLMIFLTDGFKRRVEYNGAQAFEIIYTTEQSALEFWQAHPDECVRFWEIAQLLFDRNGTLPALQACAAEITQNGKQPLDADALIHLRFDAEDQLRALENILTNDPTTTQMLLAHKVFLLTELFFDIRQLWKPAPKQSLAEIKSVNPGFHALLTQFYRDDSDIQAKLALAHQMISIVFDATS